MIDLNTIEVQTLIELPFLSSTLPEDLFLVTHLGESFKITKAALFVNVKPITYNHEQIIPSASWSINHNLGFNPAVSVVDSGGNIVFGDVIYLNTNAIQINFSSGFSGKAGSSVKLTVSLMEIT